MSLTTDWKTLATAGPTVDGREICEQDLRDIAETYDPNEYCAVIWSDHFRWYGNFGTVDAVKLGTDDKDRLILLGQVCPNKRLLSLNAEGQKLFPSIEILPNFAQSGKAYLGGLAITDEPASIGTSMLKFSQQFSKRHPDEELPLISQPFPIALDFSEAATDERSLFARFKQFLSQPDPEGFQAPTQSPEQEQPMSPEQFSQLIALQEQQTAAITALGEQFSKLAPASPEAAPATEPEAQPAGDDSAAQFNQQLTEALGQQTAALEKLSGQFAALTSEQPGTSVAPATGADQSNSKVI